MHVSYQPFRRLSVEILNLHSSNTDPKTGQWKPECAVPHGSGRSNAIQRQLKATCTDRVTNPWQICCDLVAQEYHRVAVDDVLEDSYVLKLQLGFGLDCRGSQRNPQDL